MEDTVEVAAEGRELDLEELVRNTTWRDLLTELVRTNRIDPWDVDIMGIVDGYVSAVRRMKVLDLHIPANIILAASILLRIKSDTLKLLEAETGEQAEPFDLPHMERVIPETGELVPKARLQPARKITLAELMDALGDAIKIYERREMRGKVHAEPLTLKFDGNDIDKRIDGALELIRSNADSEGLVTFARIANVFTTSEATLLNLFMPMLFLAHRNRISVFQEEFFGEILIRLNRDQNV